MKTLAAYDISLTLQVQAAMCRCDLERTDGICPQCECLCALADAVLDYDNRCAIQDNRAALGVLD